MTTEGFADDGTILPSRRQFARNAHCPVLGLNECIALISSIDRLRQIPGIGPLVATAIVAAIGNGAALPQGS